MKKFKYLLNRLMSKTATREEKMELLDKYGEESMKHLSDQEKSHPETEAKKKIKEDEFDEIVAKLPELAEEKVIPLHRDKYLLWPKIAAAAIIIAIVAGLLTINKDGYLSSLISKQDKVAPSVYSGKQLVELPDGSTALLNENSELKFTNSFGASNREVLLTGEASFDVTHDPAKPFIVRTGSVSTTVLGTAFNINAYPGQSKIKVTVVRGLVQVGDDQHVYGKVSPDEEIEVDVVSHAFVKRNAKAEEALAWQKDFIILHDVTLAQAARILEDKFKVQIKFENDSVKQCQYYGAFLSNESLKDILNIMSNVMHIRYTIEKKGDVILSGKGCD